MELLRAADILVDKIKKDYKDDVACVVLMGSYIYNSTHSKSDLDMYYIAKSEKAFKPGMTFIIDGVGFDFWPITWERLERIANHDERITSIITEGKVIYYSTEEDLKRFNDIKEKALDISDRDKFINKAQEQLNEAYKSYFQLLKAESLTEARMWAIGLIYTLTYGIALLNRITVKRGRGKLKMEILNMPLVPKDFEVLYDTVFISTNVSEIKKAYEQLLANTEELILTEQKKGRKPASFMDKVSGLYEEMINCYNKIEHALEIGDNTTALFAAVELTHEFAAAAEGTGVLIKQLPDMIGAFDPENPQSFLYTVKEHQLKLEELISSNGVEIRVFDSFDALEEHMKKL